MPQCILLEASYLEQSFFGQSSHSAGRLQLLGIARNFAKALNKSAMVGNVLDAARDIPPSAVQVDAVAHSFGFSEERPLNALAAIAALSLTLFSSGLLRVRAECFAQPANPSAASPNGKSASRLSSLA